MQVFVGTVFVPLVHVCSNVREFKTRNRLRGVRKGLNKSQQKISKKYEVFADVSTIHDPQNSYFSMYFRLAQAPVTTCLASRLVDLKMKRAKVMDHTLT